MTNQKLIPFSILQTNRNNSIRKNVLQGLQLFSELLFWEERQ